MFSITPLGSAAATGAMGFFDGMRALRAHRETVNALKKLSEKELRELGVEGSLEDYAWRIANQQTNR